jgi:hypothetical protein
MVEAEASQEVSEALDKTDTDCQHDDQIDRAIAKGGQRGQLGWPESPASRR